MRVDEKKRELYILKKKLQADFRKACEGTLKA
jgi:hypothetical protein